MRILQLRVRCVCVWGRGGGVYMWVSLCVSLSVQVWVCVCVCLGVSLFVFSCICLPVSPCSLNFGPKKCLTLTPKLIYWLSQQGKESVDNLSSYICDYYTLSEGIALLAGRRGASWTAKLIVVGFNWDWKKKLYVIDDKLESRDIRWAYYKNIT